MNEKEYLKKYRPDFKAYYSNGTGIFGVPLPKEKDIVLQQITSINDYVTREHPLEFKEAKYVGRILKRSGDFLDSVRHLPGTKNDYSTISYFDAKTIEEATSEIREIQGMIFTRRPIYREFRNLCGRIISESAGEDIVYPVIWFSYELGADTSEETIKKYGFDKYDPMHIILQPRFPKIDKIRNKNIWIENPVLRLGIDCKELEREKIYAEILDELKQYGD